MPNELDDLGQKLSIQNVEVTAYLQQDGKGKKYVEKTVTLMILKILSLFRQQKLIKLRNDYEVQI